MISRANDEWKPLTITTQARHRPRWYVYGLDDGILGCLELAAGKTWNNPALAGTYLLVRNAQEAACYELPLRLAERRAIERKMILQYVFSHPYRKDIP